MNTCKWTVLLISGRSPKWCIGICDTEQEAIDWALSDGWIIGQTCLILKLYP